ncbi:MAG TPA: RsmD family RNA methyltransferase, partial [Turneriella sp.]|nr:RsmD family RNA methyltransferase [Turneriella sp.]
GATHTTFVELAQERLNHIQRALTHLNISKESYTLVRTRAAKVLQEAFEETLPCVVWADPPYTYNSTPSNDPANLLTLYREARMAHTHPPLLIIQAHEKNGALADEYLAQHNDVKVYRYGSNCLLVLEK